ncbi:MAG: site-2 protease family protein [Thermoleophilaceae bacterium]|nr:site-2 protease family protein [Thermoleophilaceae bacterium]
MFGGRSLKLATVAGVRIGVDPSWFLVLFLIIYLLSGTYDALFPDEPILAFGLATVSALLFFTSVVLHELGHALVAIRNGIGIAGIDLWLFGGVAKMRRDSDSAGVEFRIAVAGPLVTLAIVVACAVAGVLLVGADGFERAVLLDTRAGAVETVLGYLAFVNLLVLLFNLLPGFPLDGGRIARSIAWKVTGDREKATRFAATLGRGFSYLMIAGGAALLVLFDDFFITGIWLILIGLMLGQAARTAVVQSRVSSQIAGVRVADVMDAQPVAIPADATLERAHEEFFLRYRWPWFPVVDASGRLLGLVTSGEVESVDEERRHGTTIDSVMTRDAAGTLMVDTEDSLEEVIGSRTEGLQRLGAVMAVDGDGILRGVVTLQQVRRALAPVGAAG